MPCALLVSSSGRCCIAAGTVADWTITRGHKEILRRRICCTLIQCQPASCQAAQKAKRRQNAFILFALQFPPSPSYTQPTHPGKKIGSLPPTYYPPSIHAFAFFAFHTTQPPHHSLTTTPHTLVAHPFCGTFCPYPLSHIFPFTLYLGTYLYTPLHIFCFL